MGWTNAGRYRALISTWCRSGTLCAHCMLAYEVTRLIYHCRRVSRHLSPRGARLVRSLPPAPNPGTQQHHVHRVPLPGAADDRKYPHDCWGRCVVVVNQASFSIVWFGAFVCVKPIRIYLAADQRCLWWYYSGWKGICNAALASILNITHILVPPPGFVRRGWPEQAPAGARQPVAAGG